MVLTTVDNAVTGVLLIIGAIFAIIGFAGYLYIVIATKKHTPEEIVKKFKKDKAVSNASGLIDMWGAITLGIAIIGLLTILIAVIIATKF